MRLLAVAPRPLDLRIPSDTGSLDLVRDALRSWLAGTELGRADVQDVVLAVWEVCANSIEHGANAPADEVVVRAEVDGLPDTHLGRRLGRMELPSGASGPRARASRLIHATMSSVDITSTAEGTRVTLEKMFS